MKLSELHPVFRKKIKLMNKKLRDYKKKAVKMNLLLTDLEKELENSGIKYTLTAYDSGDFDLSISQIGNRKEITEVLRSIKRVSKYFVTAKYNYNKDYNRIVHNNSDNYFIVELWVYFKKNSKCEIKEVPKTYTQEELNQAIIVATEQATRGVMFENKLVCNETEEAVNESN